MNQSDSRCTKKKDKAPRGVFVVRPGVWAIRFACSAGCRSPHEETVGPSKTLAIRAHFERRRRALDQPGWCPKSERKAAQARADLQRRQDWARVTFDAYAHQFKAWAKINHRSWRKDNSRLARVEPLWKGRKLDEITQADVQRLLDGLRDGDRAVSPATVNRYRDLLSGMFKRAIKLGLVAQNPVKGIEKLRELGGRIVYLSEEQESAVKAALPANVRAPFAFSLHTGLRWSEQAALRWRDIDVVAGIIKIGRSKNGYARQVPMNSVVRALLIELGTARADLADGDELVFRLAYRTTARVLERAVKAAREMLQVSGKDASALDGYTWHGNRHTFASRLVMAGVDLMSVKELGGWRTLSMVQRYAHLAPAHLQAAVERLVVTGQVRELGLNLDLPAARVLRSSPGVV